MYQLWTDGSYSEFTKKGGWAYLITHQNDDIMLENSGNDGNRANTIRMELRAIIEGLKYFSSDDYIEICSDCLWIIDICKNKKYIGWIQNGWKKPKGQKTIKHQEFWLELLEQIRRVKNIEWTHVRAHSGIKLNYRVDKLAKWAREELEKEGLMHD